MLISDSVFVLLLKSSSSLKLFKETKSGNRLGEFIISSDQTFYNEKIFPETLRLPVESFWITWGTKLRKFSGNLEPLTEVKTTPFPVSNYLGDNRFLGTQIVYDSFVYAPVVVRGTIITSELDTIKSSIPLSYYKDGSSNLVIGRLDNNDFLAVNKYSDKFFARSYSNDGISVKDSFLVNTSSTSFTSGLNFTVNQDKVFFTWSDARNSGRGYDIYGSIFDLYSITSVKQLISEVPKDFQLYQNYPNPFNPETKIRFAVPNVETRHASSLQVILRVYDILGREVATLIDEEKTPGLFEVSFDGNKLASGLYFYRFEAGNYIETRKMILIK
jgi:hypothetical protein